MVDEELKQKLKNIENMLFALLLLVGFLIGVTIGRVFN